MVEVRPEIDPIFYRKSSVTRVEQKKNASKNVHFFPENGIFGGLQKCKSGLRGRALPLMTSYGAKKLILAEFYGFSGLL